MNDTPKAAAQQGLTEDEIMVAVRSVMPHFTTWSNTSDQQMLQVCRAVLAAVQAPPAPAGVHATLIADLQHRVRYWRQPGIGDFPVKDATEDLAQDLERAVAALSAALERTVAALSAAAPAGERLTVHDAFDAGWRAAANWAHREDLLADMTSRAYMLDKIAALAAPQDGRRVTAQEDHWLHEASRRSSRLIAGGKLAPQDGTKKDGGTEGGA